MTLEDWQRRAATETLPERGARFVITEIYGPGGQHGFMVDDKSFPEDWRVSLNEQGTGTRTFYNEQDALNYIKEQGMIVPTEMQLHYIQNGTDVFEVYGGKPMHEWIAIGDLNCRKHVHPEPPENEDDFEQIKLFATAYAMTMTEEEAINTLSTITALESLMGGTRNPFAGIGALSDDLLGLPQGMAAIARQPLSIGEFAKAMEDDRIF